MRLGRNMWHFIDRLARCCTGAALVEWTLVLPFLLALGLGVAEFGRMLYQYQQVANGIRDAGRYLARVDAPLSALTEAQNLATRGTIDGTGALRVSYWNPADVTASVTNVPNTLIADGSSHYRGGSTILVVEVATTVTYDDIGLLDFFGLGPLTFNLSHEERVIGD